MYTKLGNFSRIFFTAVLMLFAAYSSAEKACEGYGPQAPRDIDNLAGNNKRLFSLAPDYREMNLCNIHFHTDAEHKARDFSINSGKGFQCNSTSSLTKKQLRKPKKNYCKGLKPGDTIEVHWVHSSCDVSPGEGLGSCVSESCANPDLRVEAQVFLVVNDSSAMDFNDLVYDGHMKNGLHQAKHIPDTTGKPVEFLGSTTGPKYTERSCSPYQVSWSVRPHCAMVDIKTLSKWCKDNVFNEDHAHKVRKLVTNPDLLSDI